MYLFQPGLFQSVVFQTPASVTLATDSQVGQLTLAESRVGRLTAADALIGQATTGDAEHPA